MYTSAQLHPSTKAVTKNKKDNLGHIFHCLLPLTFIPLISLYLTGFSCDTLYSVLRITEGLFCFPSPLTRHIGRVLAQPFRASLGLLVSNTSGIFEFVASVFRTLLDLLCDKRDQKRLS